MVMSSAFLRIRSSLYTLAAYSRSVSGGHRQNKPVVFELHMYSMCKDIFQKQASGASRRWSGILTCLPLLPAVISNIGHVVLFHILLYVMQLVALELGPKVAGDVVVDAQIFRLPLHRLRGRPGER